MNRKLWEAVRSVPGNAEAWFALGVAAVEASRFDEAKYALVHAVELAPRDVDRALSAGWQLASSGCVPEAERIFRSVLALHPDRLDVRMGLAQVLLMSGEERAALEEVELA